MNNNNLFALLLCFTISGLGAMNQESDSKGTGAIQVPQQSHQCMEGKNGGDTLGSSPVNIQDRTKPIDNWYGCCPHFNPDK